MPVSRVHPGKPRQWLELRRVSRPAASALPPVLAFAGIAVMPTYIVLAQSGGAVLTGAHLAVLGLGLLRR